MANAKLKCHKVTKSNTGRFRKEWNKKNWKIKVQQMEREDRK
jgi:hypothetical protein